MSHKKEPRRLRQKIRIEMKLHQHHQGELNGLPVYGYMYGRTIYQKHNGIYRVMTMLPFRKIVWCFHRSPNKPRFRNIVAIQWAMYLTVWPFVGLFKALLFVGLCLTIIPYTILFQPFFERNFDDTRSTSIWRCVVLIAALAFIAYLLITRE